MTEADPVSGPKASGDDTEASTKPIQATAGSSNPVASTQGAFITNERPLFCLVKRACPAGLIRTPFGVPQGRATQIHPRRQV